MRIVQIRARADDDGVLQLKVPVGTPQTDYQVVIVLHPASDAPPPKTPEELGWPPGYFENVIGSIQDPTFRRYPQGEFEKRLDFE